MYADKCGDWHCGAVRSEADVASHLGVTQQAVSLGEVSALKKIRRGLLSFPEIADAVGLEPTANFAYDSVWDTAVADEMLSCKLPAGDRDPSGIHRYMKALFDLVPPSCFASKTQYDVRDIQVLSDGDRSGNGKVHVLESVLNTYMDTDVDLVGIMKSCPLSYSQIARKVGCRAQDIYVGSLPLGNTCRRDMKVYWLSCVLYMAGIYITELYE